MDDALTKNSDEKGVQRFTTQIFFTVSTDFICDFFSVQLTPFTISLQNTIPEIPEVLVDYSTDCLSDKLNLATRFMYKNLKEYVEKVLMNRNEEDTVYNVDLSTLAILNLKPEVLELICTNLILECADFWSVLNWGEWKEIRGILKMLMICQEETLLKLTSPLFLIEKIVEAFVRTSNHHDDKSDIDFLHNFICFALSYGLQVHSVDLEVVFDKFGYCDLFKLLLHMDISPHCIPQKNMLAFLIYSVDDEIDFRDRLLKALSIDYESALNLHQTQLHTFVQTDVRKKCFPKLKDLARNRTRDAICKRYKIKNSCQFYTLLKQLPIAEKYKRIIAFEETMYPN